MAAPSYTEDLTDLDLADGASGWDESSDGAWDDQGAAAYEDSEYPYIQGLYAITADCTKTGTGTLISSNYGTGFTVPTDGAILIWSNFSSPPTLDTYANGGMGVLVGNSYGDFYHWDCGGNDYGSYPYGGWQNFAVDPSDATTGADAPAATDTVGTPTGTWSYFGASVKLLAGISKGEVFQVDAIRGGRCSAIFTDGDLANGYATIDGFATENDYNDVTNGYHRWGLIQAVSGGYLWKGRMHLGTSTTAVDFRDSGKVIFIQDTPNVSANFNTIEVENASSNVVMTGFQFICLDPTNTNSKGRWITTNDATVALTSCSFVDMSTFVFDSNTTLDKCTFNRCGQITTGDCDMGNSNVLESTAATDTGGLYCDTTYTDTYFDDMTFSKGTNAHHAIDFSASVSSEITLRNIEFSGFGTTEDGDDAALRFLNTTGGFNVNLVGCTVDGAAATSTNLYKDDAAAASAINLVFDPVTTLINIKDPDGNDEIDVRVYLEAASVVSGGLPFEQSITSIARTGTTCIVTFAAAHGLKSGEYLKLEGITDSDNQTDLSGAFEVSVTGATTLEYTTTSVGTTPYNGTLTGTGATIYGVTDANGDIWSSRTYGTDQPLTGYARKLDDGTTYFKTIELNGTVSSSNGLTINRRLVSDGLISP